VIDMAKKQMHRTEQFKGPLMRVSYAWQLFKPREATTTSRGGYGCTLIMPKTGDWAPLHNAIKEVVIGQWGDRGAEKWKTGLIKNPILDGAGKEARSKETGELHDGMGPEVQFIRVGSGADRPPRVFDPTMKYCSVIGKDSPYMLWESDECPSGSWGYPVLNAYAWHNDESGDGVSFGIDMIQIIKIAGDDEILGGGGGSRTKPEAFFEAVAGAGDGAKPESAGDFFG
jgi:hypothetical protein